MGRRWYIWHEEDEQGKATREVKRGEKAGWPGWLLVAKERKKERPRRARFVVRGTNIIVL